MKMSMTQTMDSAFKDIPPGRSVMAVMGREGDTKHIWDKTKPIEVEAARELFGTLKKKGYAAFHVTGENGAKGEVMHEFDPDAERIIFAPQLVGG